MENYLEVIEREMNKQRELVEDDKRFKEQAIDNIKDIRTMINENYQLDFIDTATWLEARNMVLEAEKAIKKMQKNSRNGQQ